MTIIRMHHHLPTVDGDVVIAYRQSVPSMYHVWLVIEDGQQEREATLFLPMCVATQAAAERLAREFVTETGTVFVYEQDTDSWTTRPE